MGPRDGPWKHDGAKAQGKVTVFQKMGCNWKQVSALVRNKDYTVSILLQAMNSKPEHCYGWVWRVRTESLGARDAHHIEEQGGKQSRRRQERIKNSWRSWRGNTMGRAFAMHVIDPGLISGIHMVL